MPLLGLYSLSNKNICLLSLLKYQEDRLFRTLGNAGKEILKHHTYAIEFKF